MVKFTTSAHEPWQVPNMDFAGPYPIVEYVHVKIDTATLANGQKLANGQTPQLTLLHWPSLTTLGGMEHHNKYDQTEVHTLTTLKSKSF